jgi:hypothetical protein
MGVLSLAHHFSLVENIFILIFHIGDWPLDFNA